MAIVKIFALHANANLKKEKTRTAVVKLSDLHTNVKKIRTAIAKLFVLHANTKKF